MLILEKRKELLMLSAVVILAAILLWSSAEDSQQNVVQDVERQAPTIMMDNNLEQKPPAKAIKPIKKLPPKPVAELSVDEGMQHEMQRVADIYEQRSKYAPYSLYLSAEQTDLIHPNQSHESPRAYDIDGMTLSILIEPKNYRFSSGQKVEADIGIESSVEGLNAIAKIEINLVATSSQEQWPMKLVSSSDKQGSRSIRAVIDLSTELTSFSEEDYSIEVEVKFNGESPVRQSAPIKIVTSIAEITGLGSNRIEGNDLIIPININADKSGYYQLSASLFDAASNSAVSFLIAKERLSSGSNTLEAKVQGLVLRDKGFNGPFRLQGITLVKKSERPGMAEEYGISAESYEVDAIDLNDLESIPYEDPMTEQRLEFMRNIGQ
jgi:hypothetical protein